MTETTTTPLPTPLAQLARLLEDGDFSVAYLPPSEEVPAEVLMITAAIMDGAVVPLRFIDLNEIAALHAVEGDEADPNVTQTLLGSLVFPFVVPPAHCLDVMRAAFTINRLLPVCSLGVSDAEGLCYLQASITTDFESDIPKSAALDIAGLACDTVQRYGPVLRSIATGTLSYDQFMADLRHAGIAPPPFVQAAHAAA